MLAVAYGLDNKTRHATTNDHVRAFGIVGPVKKALLLKLSRPAMIQYLCQRNNWDTKMLEIIDFDAFGRYMKALSNQRRTNVIKYIHNWQKTGRQKKFLRSKRTDNDDVEAWETTKCPHGCGELEREQHYLKCTACPHHQNKRHHLLGLKNWMIKSLTLPPLQILLLRALMDWLHRHQACTHEIKETDTYHILIKEALAEQELIGWNHFLKGRISKKWAIIQNNCYARMRQESENNNLNPIPTYLDGKWWTKKLIAYTIYTCLNLWQIRNETLAANNEKLNYIRERNELLKQATDIQQLKRSETFEKNSPVPLHAAMQR